MGTQLTGMERRISDWNSRLNTIETNYYKNLLLWNQQSADTITSRQVSQVSK